VRPGETLDRRQAAGGEGRGPKGPEEERKLNSDENIKAEKKRARNQKKRGNAASGADEQRGTRDEARF